MRRCKINFVFNICSSMNFTMSTDTAAADQQPSAVKSAALFTDGISAKTVDAEYIPLNRWNYWQETNDDVKTKATVTATPTAACILVAACMHRDAIRVTIVVINAEIGFMSSPSESLE